MSLSTTVLSLGAVAISTSPVTWTTRIPCTTLERIVARQEAYVVVEKFGEAGLTAEVENSRDGKNPTDEPDN
jgi:MOSC domain-containing protein YiiM